MRKVSCGRRNGTGKLCDVAPLFCNLARAVRTISNAEGKASHGGRKLSRAKRNVANRRRKPASRERAFASGDSNLLNAARHVSRLQKKETVAADSRLTRRPPPPIHPNQERLASGIRILASASKAYAKPSSSPRRAIRSSRIRDAACGQSTAMTSTSPISQCSQGGRTTGPS